jgi:hypothetical protein
MRANWISSFVNLRMRPSGVIVDDSPVVPDTPAYWPGFICGAGVTAVFLAIFSHRAGVSLAALLFIEAAFFTLAAVAAIEFAPQRPFHAVALCAMGVFVGVLVDVLFFPRTEAGYERNLFPIEAIAHTLLAFPIMVVVAAITYKVSRRHRKRKDNHFGA